MFVHATVVDAGWLVPLMLVVASPDAGETLSRIRMLYLSTTGPFQPSTLWKETNYSSEKREEVEVAHIWRHMIMKTWTANT